MGRVSLAEYLILAYIVGAWMYFLYIVTSLSPKKIREVTDNEDLVLPVMAMGVFVGAIAALLWPGSVILDVVGWWRKKKGGAP